MTRIVRRIVHTIAPGKWGEVMAWERRWEAVEGPHGVKPFRWYRVAFGADGIDTLVGYQEWESYAEMEAAYTRAYADPARQALVDKREFEEVFLSQRNEIYYPLE